MSNIVDICPSTCVKCYYHIGGQSATYGTECDYITIEGHSRIFDSGTGRRKPCSLVHKCDSFLTIREGQKKFNGKINVEEDNNER